MTVGAGDEHKAVMRISKVKGKGVHLYRSYTFQLFQGTQTNSCLSQKKSPKKKKNCTDIKVIRQPGVILTPQNTRRFPVDSLLHISAASHLKPS